MSWYAAELRTKDPCHLLEQRELFSHRFRHYEDLLPPGIVGAHLRGEIIAQLLECRAKGAGIIIDVPQAIALILNKRFLLFD